ncbi:hypothetical protein BASA81_002432 [Batrachochytrium salamandrivorans]|nr:hypothetical protein BASA81_002432 [Batrachochytrium salamandrivorans]
MSTFVCGVGDLVWVPAASKDSSFLFQQAKVLAVDDSSCTMRTIAGDRVVQLDLLRELPLMVNSESNAADMTSLHHIHEPGILANLKTRSLGNSPYSFMSSVLIAINPLRPIPDPFPPGHSLGSSAPHPYVVAEIAFQQMMFATSLVRNQSIVIAGESGAGKTESAKMVLAHLVAKAPNSPSLSPSSMQSLDKRLLSTSPILESFGNSATLRNPNSSRFGKMMRLHFEAQSNVLRGATVQSYLLERSRVTSHESGERSFHVLYQLLASTDSQAVEALQLRSNMRYVTPGKVSPKQDLEGYELLVNALHSIGITDPSPVFEVLAGVLHLGEIVFVDEDQGTEGNTAKVVLSSGENNNALQVCADLLGLDAVECGRVFCERKLVVQNKVVVSKRSARAAGFARDAAAKAIYASLFDWLVKRINDNVGSEIATSQSPTVSLGVLDIFGFESFKVNQFEQLLINYCNEALQGTFNAQIFVAEASLYEREGLFSAGECLARPSDNGICVEFLQSKTGLLSVIDSEGKSPDCSDAKMLQKVHTLFGNHPALVKPHPKDAARTFIVRHYCSQVVYTVGSFLEKNNDRLPEDLEQFLGSSNKQMVRELFAKPVQFQGRAPPPARSISAKFTAQIRTLVDDLENTKCSFIRCVKPNPNMYRTCEVLRNGFPTRLDYSVLVDSYRKVLPSNVLERYNNKSVANPNKAFCRALFFAFGISPDSYKLGNTMAFFKSGQLAQLDSVLKSASALGGLSEEVLTRFRLCYIRTKWRKILLASLALEKFNVMFQRARKQTLAATKLQAFVRTSLARRVYLRQQRGAMTVQRLFRGRKARKLALEMRLERIREAKRLAELAEKTKREREDAAKRALMLEIQEEKKRKEAVKQAKAVEEALARQELESRAQEEKDLMKRRQSVKMDRKSVIALKASKRSDISVTSSTGEMSSLRSKTLGGARKSMAPLSSSAAAAAAAAATSAGGETGDEDPKRRRKSVKFQPVATKERQSSATSSMLRLQRRNKSITSVFASPASASASTRLSVSKPAATSPSLTPPQKFAKPYSLMEQKSSLEKISTLARENFCIKVRGMALVLDTNMFTETVDVTVVNDDGDDEAFQNMGMLSKLKSKLLKSKAANAVAAVTTTTSASSITKRWVKLSYQLDKPARQLMFFTEGEKTVDLLVELTATLKVRTVAVAKQQHAIELKCPNKSAIYVAFETLEEKRVWERDVREAVIGFRAQIHRAADQGTKYSTVEGDGRMGELYSLYSDQIRQERLAQIAKLYKQGEISKEEFDRTCEVIAATPDPVDEDPFKGEEEEYDGLDLEGDFGSQVHCPKCGWSNNTMFGRFQCVKCGQVLKQQDGEEGVGDVGGAQALTNLQYPFARDMPFEDGRVSAELVGCERTMDFTTYQEISLFGIDLRFRDEELLDLQVGWLISHRLDKFAALHAALVSTDGPLTVAARKKIPPFPPALREDLPTAAQELGVWLNELFKLVPQGGKQTDLIYHEEQDDAMVTDQAGDEAAAAAAENDRFTAEWRSVKDVETGDVYYFNKVTGETTWVNPFNVRAMRDLKIKLPVNWEAVVDKETNDVYYWNTVTLETTWEKPKAATGSSSRATLSKKRKLLEAKDLLHVAVVNRFLDLKRNTQRMDELAIE